MHGKMRNAFNTLIGRAEGRRTLGDLGAEGRI
jgi:hypothetical protein